MFGLAGTARTPLVDVTVVVRFGFTVYAKNSLYALSFCPSVLDCLTVCGTVQFSGASVLPWLYSARRKSFICIWTTLYSLSTSSGNRLGVLNVCSAVNKISLIHDIIGDHNIGANRDVVQRHHAIFRYCWRRSRGLLCCSPLSKCF